MQKPFKINSTLILLNSFVFHCSRCKVLVVFKHGLYLISAYQISFSFLSMACLHRNLWAHLHCWFYRMASVQYRQHNPWKVSVCLLVRSYFLAHLAHIHVSWALLIEFCWFYSIRFSFALCTAAAGSAVSVKPASDSVTPASVSSMGTLTDSSSASLLTTANQTPLSALGHNEDLPPSSMAPPQHNKWDAANLLNLNYDWC